MPDPVENLSSTIKVERDGIRLGWNVLAVLATIGLGLYVSSVITPIVNRVEKLEEARRELTADLVTLQGAYTEHVTASAASTISLEKDIDHLTKDCGRCAAASPQFNRQSVKGGSQNDGG